MTNPHIFYNGEKIICSVCSTGPEQIVDGKSEHFKIHAMRNLKNPGKHDENLLWHAECLVCKRQTPVGDLPYLYY